MRPFLHPDDADDGPPTIQRADWWILVGAGVLVAATIWVYLFGGN